MRTALVTGGNRGIGREVCRALSALGYHVYLGSRDVVVGRRVARAIQSEGDIECVRLDVTSGEDVSALSEHVGENLDVLVNNAGIYNALPFRRLSVDDVRQSCETNMLGPFSLISEFLPKMNRRGQGRIINVSSGYGTFSDRISGPAAYGISKAALNALTVVASQEAEGNVEVNAVCPGWVRTDMGGDGAPRDVSEGADTIVWLATRPADGGRINGQLLRDRKVVQW
ncbi:SDR family NAD(P)-dependent oxidoreductase [Actinomyces lilanjuaniae]|uniref:SDR family NAD(P)-dependent oxidoreductase n=1 Tax=Actinomyces lilanjuaniae TaxID=2321394 RepID=A0ABN5PSF7_9ACTO|nr:SDR family NAD(P)-dependent oxidoreductase [Actinomyces lilanjuaniae]AYD89735.1 SDR family NAD(P)-dependent oxidoreductase [Actinomyces lilanjuaniae]